eukprot:5380863-Amphidinium_carterae.1
MKSFCSLSLEALLTCSHVEAPILMYEPPCNLKARCSDRRVLKHRHFKKLGAKCESVKRSSSWQAMI